MADAIRNVIRNVTSSVPHGRLKRLATLQCGHQVVVDAVRVPRSIFTYRAPFTAACPNCKESPNG